MWSANLNNSTFSYSQWDQHTTTFRKRGGDEIKAAVYLRLRSPFNATWIQLLDEYSIAQSSREHKASAKHQTPNLIWEYSSTMESKKHNHLHWRNLGAKFSSWASPSALLSTAMLLHPPPPILGGVFEPLKPRLSHTISIKLAAGEFRYFFPPPPYA